MSQMVERVARAICCPSGKCSADCDAPLMYCQITHHMPSARAAIAAMRGATEYMHAEAKRAMADLPGSEYAAAVWPYMIDAALSDKDQ